MEGWTNESQSVFFILGQAYSGLAMVDNLHKAPLPSSRCHNETISTELSPNTQVSSLVSYWTSEAVCHCGEDNEFPGHCCMSNLDSAPQRR